MLVVTFNEILVEPFKIDKQHIKSNELKVIRLLRSAVTKVTDENRKRTESPIKYLPIKQSHSLNDISPICVQLKFMNTWPTGSEDALLKWFSSSNTYHNRCVHRFLANISQLAERK